MNQSRENSILFTPVKVGRVLLPNRFVRSATHDFMANDDGTVTERQVALFSGLAKGEVGLIITGHAYVNPAGKASPRQIGVHEERMIEGLNMITHAVHRFPSRIFLQIAHAGRQTKEKYCGCTPLAPSAVYEPTLKIMPKEMTPAEIGNVSDDFIEAARRARQAGFDGVQLHGAHGYLLSSFISPYTNRRQDEWGGILRNRARIVSKIIRGIKKSAGADFPVIIKINSSDFLPQGLELEESIESVRILEEDGLDGIEVSGGTSEARRGSMWPGLRQEDEEGYFVDDASEFKKVLHVPVFGLGGNRTFKVMESMVKQGKVDLISMSRPFIREPFLVRKFRTGEINKSECISCNKCFNLRGIRCADIK